MHKAHINSLYSQNSLLPAGYNAVLAQLVYMGFVYYTEDIHSSQKVNPTRFTLIIFPPTYQIFITNKQMNYKVYTCTTNTYQTIYMYTEVVHMYDVVRHEEKYSLLMQKRRFSIDLCAFMSSEIFFKKVPETK